MTELKAGHLNLKPINKEWDGHFASILTAKRFSEIIAVYRAMEQEELEYCYDKARDILSQDTGAKTGIGELAGAGGVVGTGAVAGGFAASVFGTTTVTSSGLFGTGLFATTTVVAAPATLVLGVAASSAFLSYGIYKLISSSASAKAKSQQIRQNIKEGRDATLQPQRNINPFVFTQDYQVQILGLYDSLHLFEGAEDLADYYLLDLFDLGCLHFNDVESFGQNSFEAMRAKINALFAHIKQEQPALKAEIDRAIALVEINMEFITPRVLHEDMRQLSALVREGMFVQDTLSKEQAKAEFALCKILLSHSQNNPEQSKQQIALMEQIFAEKYGEYGARIADEMFKDTRPTKLNEGNFLEYLREILGIFEKENAQNFISTLYDDLHEYVKLDGKIEEYEENILKQISSLKD